MRNPTELEERIVGLGVGTALVVLAVVVSAIWHDSGLAVVFAVAGVALIVFGVVANRLKSIGPGGVEFYEIREGAARLVGLMPPGTRTLAGGSSPEDAAASIRAAATPEQLAKVLTAISSPGSDPGRASPGMAANGAAPPRRRRAKPSSGG